ncbi:MAG: 50S ribosomal protein L25/general stress protein Ctc [Bacteroidaceae bacterium]|nr:50S ribosomal protein L25/general stress protein Ctc [Bacteroidaceae bacterium]MBR1755363.1 50S ribosomal protein L25/general stress protein Ctc [Bacteroidaceae bacterium]
MKTIEIKGTARVAGGKKAAKQLRKQGVIPCNLYGELKDEKGLPKAFSFAVTEGELRKLLYSPDIYTVKLDVDGQQCLAILKEAQFHPVKDNVLHVDFYQITDEKPIVMEVPIRLNGLAAGVKAGGKLAASVRKLKVRAPHTAIPERLDIDVTNLELGKTIKVAELSFEGLELVTSPSVVVCQVKMTRNARSAAAAEEQA